MAEWRIPVAEHAFYRSIRRVLDELDPTGLTRLNDPAFEVMVLRKADTRIWSPCSVWAYFPVHRRRWITKKLNPRPATRMLLVFGMENFEEEKPAEFEWRLRDHIGHVLLYLRSPRAKNDCPDAMKEWKSHALPDTPANPG